MANSPAGFPRDIRFPQYLRVETRSIKTRFAYGTITLFGAPFQASSATEVLISSTPHLAMRLYLATPISSIAAGNGFRLLPVRSPLLGESFLFLRLLRCFTSAGLRLPYRYGSHAVLPREVSPFGNLRINGCSTPPRSLSQSRHVLHRPDIPRHPPCASTRICNVLASNS